MSDEIKEAGGGAAAPSWKDRLKLRADLRQRDVYAFETHLAEIGGISVDGASVRASHALKAAISAGWLEAPASEVLKTATGEPRYFIDGEELDDMHAGKVLFIGSRIVQAYIEAITIPPN